MSDTTTKQFSDEMRFVLFINDKGDNDKRPNMRGKVTVLGVEYDMSGWTKISAQGTKYLAGSLTPKRDKPPMTAASPAQVIADDDVPF